MRGPDYWGTHGVDSVMHARLSSKATHLCPQCDGDGLYLDCGGLPVSCECTEGVTQLPRSPELNRHTRNQGVW